MKSTPATLSSPLTFFWKFAAIPLLVGIFAVLALGIRKQGNDAAQSAIGTIVVLCGMMFLILWLLSLLARLKRVVIREGALYVSNYRTEIRVPFSEVVDVRESSDLRWFLVRIDLRRPTALGQRIEFRPRLRFYWSRPHPVVRELRRHCQLSEPGPASTLFVGLNS